LQDLDPDRLTNWGVYRIMTAHILSHGEINHIDAVSQADDRWQYE
jgi:hypothetical protein